MGHDDIFKKRHAQTVERKKEQRQPKPNSFLIVTEGEKTEPLYLKGLEKYINEKYGGNIELTIRGEGKCTVSLVEKAEEIFKGSKPLYSEIWVVFDKDDFEDFDEAIELANKYGFHVAWSNQSFEYWIYLHFNYSESALHRDNWVEKLNKIYQEKHINNGKYKKSDPNIFDIATKYGKITDAIHNAEKVHKLYDDQKKPSLCDPCTTVYELIYEIKSYIKDFS